MIRLQLEIYNSSKTVGPLLRKSNLLAFACDSTLDDWLAEKIPKVGFSAYTEYMMSEKATEYKEFSSTPEGKGARGRGLMTIDEVYVLGKMLFLQQKPQISGLGSASQSSGDYG